MDEESGARAAKPYTKDYSAEFIRTVAAIESDSGAAHPLGFSVRMTPHATELLRPVQVVLQSFGANATQPSTYPPGADISAMSEAGVPALGLLQDGRTYFNYHHTAASTLDKVVPSRVARERRRHGRHGIRLSQHEGSAAAVKQKLCRETIEAVENYKPGHDRGRAALPGAA